MKKTPLLLLTCSLALASCSENGADPAESAATESELSPALVLSEAPPEPVAIATLRTSAKAGESVAFRGKLIGKNPLFMEGRAVMVMGDPKKLTSCDQIPEDQCPTPWDVCCDDPALVTASIVTVQVVDEEGKPLHTALKGLGGMKELSHVSVVGEIDESSTETNMLVNATGFYIHPEPAAE